MYAIRSYYGIEGKSGQTGNVVHPDERQDQSEHPAHQPLQEILPADAGDDADSEQRQRKSFRCAELQCNFRQLRCDEDQESYNFV